MVTTLKQDLLINIIVHTIKSFADGNNNSTSLEDLNRIDIIINNAFYSRHITSPEIVKHLKESIHNIYWLVKENKD